MAAAGPEFLNDFLNTYEQVLKCLVTARVKDGDDPVICLTIEGDNRKRRRFPVLAKNFVEIDFVPKVNLESSTSSFAFRMTHRFCTSKRSLFRPISDGSICRPVRPQIGLYLADAPGAADLQAD